MVKAPRTWWRLYSTETDVVSRRVEIEWYVLSRYLSLYLATYLLCESDYHIGINPSALLHDVGIHR